MREFIKHQSTDATAKTIPDEQILNKQERVWFDARNFYLKGVTFSMQYTQQISIAITKLQGLTNALKVHLQGIMRKLVIKSKLYFIVHL